MDTNQAAKLAQAYQWLSEEKEVEYSEENSEQWFSWNGDWYFKGCRFRLKPEPAPLLECWVNLYADGCETCALHPTEERAKRNAMPHVRRTAVHLREVRDEQ